MSLQELIIKEHNPDLVDPNESPNGNTQTLVFNDGEIMSTKGGWAFLQRSMFSLYPSKNCNIDMPQKLNDKHSFAIVKDLETALKIRELMN